MSIYNCPLCGYDITPLGPGGVDAWVARFRAVYSESDNVSLSGVGLYDNRRGEPFLVPRSSSKTYEDLESGEVPGTEIDDVDYGDESPGVWGFVFHDACWKLLDALYGKDNVPLGRLHAVLRSLSSPVGMFGVSWGHTYGGLYRAGHEGEKLWNCMFHLSERDESEQGNAAPCNPFRIPRIARPHRKCRAKDPFLQFTWGQRGGCGRDPFARLPPEIIRMVVDLLRVRDVGAARGASRFFVPVFLDQNFWRTRFEARGERAWLFEARRSIGCGKELDWRYLYRRKRRRYLSLQELNRARIWPILEEARDVLSLEWSGPASSPPGVGVTGDDGDVPDRHWLTVSGDISDIPPADDICGGRNFCYRFREQVIHLPGAITAISASVVRLEEMTYVTGMSVTPAGHGSTRAGYLNPRFEESLDVTGSKGGYVKGFNLAVGRWGIQAIQCIFSSENTSRWIGRPGDVPISRLSAPDGLVHGLKADFDGFKMVALSIPTTQSGSGAERMAIWYPQVPPQTLDMHSEFVTTQDKGIFDSYQPLFWTAFGGPDGRYLRNLTSISSPLRGVTLILHFGFNSDAVPPECRQLVGDPRDDGSDSVSFLIDGPGGEIIRQVEVILQAYNAIARSRQTWSVFGVKVTTNRDRTCTFERGQRNERRLYESLEFRPPPGRLIAGFYMGAHIHVPTVLGVLTACV